jgi:hypothetical protein
MLYMRFTLGLPLGLKEDYLSSLCDIPNEFVPRCIAQLKAHATSGTGSAARAAIRPLE